MIWLLFSNIESKNILSNNQKHGVLFIGKLTENTRHFIGKLTKN
jgi:hypothetical protein